MVATKRLKRNRKLLETLNGLNRSVQESLLPYLRKDTILVLVECIKNIISGNVPLSESQLARVRQSKTDLKTIARAKTSRDRRVKLLQKGGLLGALLGPIVKILGDLLGSGTR